MLENVALPFASQLNWSHLMINVMDAEVILNQPRMQGFLMQLRDMPLVEVRDRLEYIRSVRHMFMYDAHPQKEGHDAPAALLTELERRLSFINNVTWVHELEKRQQEQEILSSSFLCERLNQAGPRPCPPPVDTVNPGRRARGLWAFVNGTNQSKVKVHGLVLRTRRRPHAQPRLVLAKKL